MNADFFPRLLMNAYTAHNGIADSTSLAGVVTLL